MQAMQLRLSKDDNMQNTYPAAVIGMLTSLLCCICIHGGLCGPSDEDPTLGFVSLPLNSSNFQLDTPYDLPKTARYSFIDGVHRLWVYSTDKPLARSSNTNPRSEIRIRGYDYSSGIWQFEGYGFVPNGTSGVCVMQLFGAANHSTTVMMRVHNGSLTYYDNPIGLPDIYDRWFRLNVIHDVGAKNVSIFVDGVLKLTVRDRGGTHHFKCGVYEYNNSSYYMESRWKDIKVLRKYD